MKKLILMLLIGSGCILASGCCLLGPPPPAEKTPIRTVEENTSRVIESRPVIGQPPAPPR